MGKFRLDQGQIEVMDDQMAEILRQKTFAERICIGFEIWLSSQRMLKAHLKTSQPTWSTEQVDQEVARRIAHGTL